MTLDGFKVVLYEGLSARLATSPSSSRPPHPLPPDPSRGCLRSSWRQWPRRGIRCDCRIPAAGTHPGVHCAHPWSRRHRRRATQSFPLHHRLRCCGHSLCSAGSGDVRRFVWHGMRPDLLPCGPPSRPHWSTPLFVQERPVPCTFCCHPEEHCTGHYRPVRSTPRTCPPFAPLS
jgi:hypothetical protein